jgi:hypothetical protein
MPPFTAWSKTISPIGAGSGRFDAQRLPETTIVEKYRIRAGQEANVLSVNIAIHVEVEIGLAVAIVIESALGNQEAQRNAEFGDAAAIRGIINEAAFFGQQLLGGGCVSRRIALDDDIAWRIGGGWFMPPVLAAMGL